MNPSLPGLILLALVAVARPAAADVLDCDSELAEHKEVSKLGSGLELVTCTDAADPVLGRAYVRYRDPGGSTRVHDLRALGGCGPDAVQARASGDDILVTFRTCQSREYHPEPAWVVRSYRLDRRNGTLTERRWQPKPP